MRALTTMLLASVAALSACTSDETLRLDGMTIGAGEAIAANTAMQMAMQMVDPWPRGVENTKLRTPAFRKLPVGAKGADPAPSPTNP